MPCNLSKSAKSALKYTVAFVGLNDDIKMVLAYISDAVDGNTTTEVFNPRLQSVGVDH